MPQILSIIKKRKENKLLTKENVTKDVIAGIIVGIIALPLSVALGISSGVSPEKGLITAIIAGFCIAAFGGSRVQIGGPTGAFVVIVYGIVQKHGLDGLILATLMSGAILLIMGLLRLGNLIKYIPRSIVIGFTAGIGVTLLVTQVKDFLGLSIESVPAHFIPKIQSYIKYFLTLDGYTLLIGALSIATIILFPKIKKLKLIPGSLVAILISVVLCQVFDINVATIGSTFGEISSNIPMPTFPNISMAKIKPLIVPAFTIAILAAIESLLCAVVADEMISDKHDSNMELIGQGIGNIASALFGGIPATGAIARTAANVKNGGRTPIAGMVHALTLLLVMKLFMPFIKYVPLATLAAILIMVSINMIEIKHIKAIAKESKMAILELSVTFILTVVNDLVVAIATAMTLHLVALLINKLFNKKKDVLPKCLSKKAA